ncbi:MAG: sigma-70 family RNA polymerase sigma factor [Actinomycetota bacterium]|nr:sigma-70 family RNA polymerase sigma factor [Actinomycetota bacterium]
MRVRDAEAELEQALEVFLAERTRLLRVAYRVVGDVAQAEDVVQDAWLRWQRMDRREVKNPAAWLTTATTHLAINMIQSARQRHETPTDLPRAVVGRPSEEPAEQAERALAGERMLGFLMAKLTSSELAAYLLRKCFEYPYQEIAEVLRTSAPNARQLVRRSQASIAGSRVRRVDAAAHRRLVQAFTAATGDGDVERLERLLAELACRCPASTAGRRQAGRQCSARPVRAQRSTPSPPAA